MTERTQLILIDFLTINSAWCLYYLFRVRSGVTVMSVDPDFFMPMVLIFIYWALIFLFFGLYRPWHAASRTDEFTSLLKAISIGCLILFFAIFVDDAGVVNAKISSRMLILVYWGIMVGTTGTGRVLYRTARRRLLTAGVGSRNALIVGWNDKAKNLYDLVLLHPALGYRVIGFVKLDKT
jgi:FlaA1/EpsC-like NDP-sugar epimerase